MTTQENKTMHRVLTIGPSRKTLGGMASVLNVYSDTVPGFRHLSSNSRRGPFAGLFSLAGTLLKMPVYRLLGRNILHVHSASGKSFVRKSWIMRFGRTLGYKIIFHCHGGASKEYYRTIGLPKAKKVISLASAIVVLSQSWKEYFETTFALDNVRVLSNPVILPEVPLMPDTSAPLQLLFLGRFGDLKGIFDLLDVIARNQERWRGRVYLRAGGDGEVERFISHVREAGIEDMVEFIGWVSGPVKEMAFASSHILLLPSYNEGLPISVLEGLAYGKPIIATPVGGIPEVVRSHTNGILVTPGDRKALAEAIDCYLLNPELIERHGRESRKAALAFSPESITAQLLDLYQSIE
ncbi:MAG: glycosyltransferase family 4 protein [Muribaculaceae bacterium]|nr:glycosyltransferase family 4 protein [Muribaculaceae bacterium]